MDVRETIRKKPAVAIAAVVVVVAAAIAYGIWTSTPSGAYSQAFFSTDDGKTVFSASMDQIPPFTHHGQPADRAWMFTCDGGKTRFVGYLERYTPEAKTKFEAAMVDYKAGKTHVAPSPGAADTEVKKPGAGNPWVSQADYQKAKAITDIPCPNGGRLELALP